MAKEEVTQKKSAKSTTKRQNNKKNEKKEVKNKVVKAEVVQEKKVEKKEELKKIPVVKKIDKKNNETILERIDNHRSTILACVVGFLLATLLFRCILWPDRIATLSDGTQPVATVNGTIITANDLYENMKKVNSLNYLLNSVDSILLDEIYPDNDEIEDEVQKEAESYYSYYEQYYSYSKEAFLSNYGFSEEKVFLDELKLAIKREDYYEDYVEGLVTEKEIEDYYKDEVYGDVDTKHILVNIGSNDDGLTNDEAKKMATEIIKKLDDGATWEDVIEEYKDNITDQELGYQAFNANFEAAYLKEMKSLKVGTYSKKPVQTSYGYHIVYKIDQKEKPELDEVKDDIVDILAAKLKKDITQNDALVKLREEKKLEFTDSKFAEQYEKSLNK